MVTDWLFRQWYVFVVMELKTRRIVHTGVTKYPTDEWTAQQLREATPWGKGPKYLIRDRDKKYATHFSAVAGSIKEVKKPYRTPEANGVCERFMGSLRRECMDHILIHDVKHLQRVVNEYTSYFNQERPVLATCFIRPDLCGKSQLHQRYDPKPSFRPILQKRKYKKTTYEGRFFVVTCSKSYFLRSRRGSKPRRVTIFPTGDKIIFEPF